MSDSDMIKLVRDTIGRLGLKPNILKGGKAVLISRPYITKPSIPRFVLTWNFKDERYIRMEIESEHGTVKALTVSGRDFISQIYAKSAKSE
jgi:hypothetical protein